MKKMITNIIYLVVAVAVCMCTFAVYQNANPIEADVPVVTLAQVHEQEEVTKEKEQISAARARQRRWINCKQDDDCVIIDREPCGCLVGAKGVIAINVNLVTEYEEKYLNKTKACPEEEPFQEGPCSPSAYPICKNKTCTIVF